MNRVTRGALLLVAVAAVMWVVGPYEPVDLAQRFDAARLGNDPAGYLATEEARVPDIRAGAEKRIVWAAEKGAKTPLSLVYFHGFSATSEEIRPVPDRLAEALGANLVYTRFAGHGRDAAAMGEGTAGAWMRDAAEALAVARAVGEEVVIISTSTGGTIAALAARDAEMARAVKGIIFVSPNFGINNAAAPLLTLPAARYWVPWIVGAERVFEPRNAGQAKHWTTRYPTVALLPLAALAKAAARADYSAVRIPGFFFFTDQDQVVRAEKTRAVIAGWGGQATVVAAPMGEGVDTFGHVVAGDIISPANTTGAYLAMLEWIRGL